MHNSLQAGDYLAFLVYFIIVSAYGYYVYRKKKSKEASSRDFFLAEGALTWWAIGASLIASNISAEQFIGMSGSGFAMGLAIASYEWMAAATLLIVAVFFLPIYLKNNIFTMPQFLARRYDHRVSSILAVFWLLVYVFVNLTSILYLGALSLQTILDIPFSYCMIGLALFAILITLGGMKVIGYTDVIQVFFLVLGGLATTYLALDLVGKHWGGSGWWDGFNLLRQKAPSHFHMIFDKSHPYYKDLPGLSVLLGGMWVVNLYYWGCNQYITQRALGAKDLDTAQKGILFAAFLKLLMPLIVVLPGIAAFVLFQSGMFQTEMTDGQGTLRPDHAYPVLLNLLPAGLKGLSLAALTAAIVASLAGKTNSIATIFTLDIYKNFLNKNATEKQLVKIGKIAVLAAFAIALLVAPLLQNLEQGFQYIQEYTGFISPGVFAVFLLGFFWKRATSNAALAASLLTIPLSALIKFWLPEMPFIDRIGIVFLALVLLMVTMSWLLPEEKTKQAPIETNRSLFKTSTAFNIGAVLICGILAGLYLVFW